MTTPRSFSTISEAARDIRSKKLSPVELVESHLGRIASLQPKLNAFVHLDADRARAQARAAETAMSVSEPPGPLRGVPLTIKSCIDVAGWPCPAGSLLRKDYVPRTDAPLVARLKSAGAVLLGNTNTPEFLMAYETDNLLTGKTSNPWNLKYSAGGSSGGEAAAIAAGCSMGGVGSDGGGSLRVPAHFCGICGLKPTPGRIPTTGHFPSGAGAFGWIGVVGPMARTIADVRALFEVMAGPDAGDTHSAPVPLRSYSATDLPSTRISLGTNRSLVPCSANIFRTPLRPILSRSISSFRLAPSATSFAKEFSAKWATSLSFSPQSPPRPRFATAQETTTLPLATSTPCAFRNGST